MATSAHVKPARELVKGDWININGVARKLKMIYPSPFTMNAMVGLAIGDGARLYPVSLSADAEIEYVSNEEMEGSND